MSNKINMTKMANNMEMNIHLSEEVKVLENSYKQQGGYTTFWNGLNNNGDVMPSGIYFVKISNFEFQDIKKVTLLK